ncbi:hypothetical protein LX97_00676 [Nonlabens dokdonensis]|uniref:Tetratricopeptide repeat protein n=2 Tax=Nonlabens dokdonensis TaxID=328515 RepID=L7WAS1_NONDD|nr:hypothetical protein [Nonlabens dokdonensis]AGC75998.1 hypothetical protein DDD_0871 [Nonlabens dokdonensis DSW-6]PZX43674.1 hypothetical protein LX97_00676 [Nonlabens dokdonensis]
MVNTARINEVIAHPESIHVDHISILEKTLEEYPYFQSARSLYLKGLKNQNSPLYNRELQKTAAHTTDRSVLFDFITSASFSQNEISDHIKNLQLQDLENSNDDSSPVEKVITVIREEDFNANKDFTKITDKDLFEKKEETSIIDEPLDFDKNETHSFSTWLQLTTLKPIDRENETALEKQSEAGKYKVENEAPQIKPVIQEVDDRARKMAKIDQFLAEKPKIKPRKGANSAIQISISNEDPSQFMTETLAKVYLAQKNYSKALKAYEILLLQHPEKSGLFADRIQEIKNLQSNNI